MLQLPWVFVSEEGSTATGCSLQSLPFWAEEIFYLTVFLQLSGTQSPFLVVSFQHAPPKLRPWRRGRKEIHFGSWWIEGCRKEKKYFWGKICPDWSLFKRSSAVFGLSQKKKKARASGSWPEVAVFSNLLLSAVWWLPNLSGWFHFPLRE